MFDIAWSEFLLIGAVALVVIGPKDLPKAMRTVGQAIGKVRRMAAEFQGQFNDAMREAELADLKKQVEDVGGSVTSTPASTAASDFKPIEMPAEPPAPDAAALKEAEAKLAALPPPEPLQPVDIAAELAPPAEEKPEEKPKRRRKTKAEEPAVEAAPVVAEPAAEPAVEAETPKPRRRAKAAAETETVADAAPARPARARKAKAPAGNEGSPA